MKCGSLPAKADGLKQREFFEKTLLSLMKKAKDGELALFFLDASHFVMGCDFLGYIYGKRRKFVKTFSGRKRYNVLGALDYASKRILTITNNSYITATEICEMLQMLSKEYKGKEIHIVLDNARYQKCKAVQDLAEKLKIDIVYIPPYSPNLNMIERIWKFTKGELRSKYYENFDLFKERIDSILESTTSTNKEKISKLIGEKVQLFDNVYIISDKTSYNDTAYNNVA